MEIIISVVLCIMVSAFFMGFLFHEGMIDTAELCLAIVGFALVLISIIFDI